jgi:aconitate hydratase
MGVLPLQLLPGQSAGSLGLTGEETITIRGLAAAVAHPARRQVEVHAGVLPSVLRSVASGTGR